MIKVPYNFKPYLYQIKPERMEQIKRYLFIMHRKAGKNMMKNEEWTDEEILKDTQDYIAKKTKSKGENMSLASLVFVDCESSGPCPGCGELTEFGAVIHKTKKTFYGDLRGKTPYGIALTFLHFRKFLESNCESRPIFVSDNPAFDWQWINYYFHHIFGMNPFGWSARRIGDYFAGLQGDFRKSNDWKKLRVTVHDHNPVNDAMGNVEAFDRFQLNYKIEKDKAKSECVVFNEFDERVFKASAGGTNE